MELTTFQVAIIRAIQGADRIPTNQKAILNSMNAKGYTERDLIENLLELESMGFVLLGKNKQTGFMRATHGKTTNVGPVSLTDIGESF